MLKRTLANKIGLKILGAMLVVSVLPLTLLGYSVLGQVEAINEGLIVQEERAFLAETEAQRQMGDVSSNPLPQGPSSMPVNSAKIREQIGRLRWQLSIGAIALTALVTVVAVALSHHITRPIYELTAGATAIAQGNLGEQVSVRGDDEIGQLACVFNRMSQRVSEDITHLNELDRVKSGFITTAAHDLKTPLSSLVFCSEMLLDYPDESPETQREFLGVINAEGNRLARMIDDVLELSRLDSGRVDWQIEELSLAEVIEEALEVTEELATERAIEVKLSIEEGLPSVQADREALVKTIANLVSNATNSSEPEGEIEVRAWHEGEVIRLDVVDHGPGMAAENQEKVFERFARVVSHTADRPTGTGLELAISKEIIERLGGCIWVRSEPGKGSTFSFTLPPGEG